MTESKENLISALKQAKESGILSVKEYEAKLDSILNPSETFSSVKFKRVFSLLDPVEWIKSLKELGILDLRKWIIFALIAGCIYGWGYVKGHSNKQPILNWNDGKEHWVSLNEHYLHISPGGTMEVVAHDKKTILKRITSKDIPGLTQKLKTIGIDINPFFTAGYGASIEGKSGPEAGIGVSLFKFYKAKINTWLTNAGVYLGPSYQITNNFSAIMGAGKGFSGDSRVYIGGKWEF